MACLEASRGVRDDGGVQDHRREECAVVLDKLVRLGDAHLNKHTHPKESNREQQRATEGTREQKRAKESNREQQRVDEQESRRGGR